VKKNKVGEKKNEAGKKKNKAREKQGTQVEAMALHSKPVQHSFNDHEQEPTPQHSPVTLEPARALKPRLPESAVKGISSKAAAVAASMRRKSSEAQHVERKEDKEDVPQTGRLQTGALFSPPPPRARRKRNV